MNRTTAERIAADMAAGRTVLVVSPTWAQCRAAADLVASLTRGEPRVHRRSTVPEVIHLQGRARFTIPRGARGVSADTVVLDHHDTMPDSVTDEVTPCIATSTDGEIVYA